MTVKMHRSYVFTVMPVSSVLFDNPRNMYRQIQKLLLRNINLLCLFNIVADPVGAQIAFRMLGNDLLKNAQLRIRKHLMLQYALQEKLHMGYEAGIVD